MVGQGLYSLSEAIDFAKRQKVEVIGLFPGNYLGTDGEDMKNQVESTGGKPLPDDKFGHSGFDC